MIKPTAQEVQEYADSIGFDLDAEYFIAKNDAVGWMVGSRKNAKPAVSWKGIVQTWHIAARRRQKATQATVGEKVTRQRSFKPTVFVQCVKGPTTGRYLPIILRESHLKDISDEQYVAAAEEMCEKLNQVDGSKWVVRADVDERALMRERSACYADKIKLPRKNFKKQIKKKGPLGIKKEIYEQLRNAKQLEDDLKF